MDLSEFEQSVLKLRKQFDRILAMIPTNQDSDGRVAQLAFDQLFEALEELQVAQEELRAQNEQLEVATQETRQAETRYQDLREGHLGIAGMLERAEAVNGSLQVISQPGQGTTIRVVVPIEQ